MNNITVEHVPEEGIIRLQIDGEVDAKVLSAASSQLVVEINRSNCERILMDHRRVKLNIPLADLFHRPKIAAELGVPHSSRIAIVYSERYEDYQFVETVGRNRGFNVRIFKDIQKGIEWLKSDPAR